MSLSKIVLQLARNPGLPNGDAGQGYTLVAPLDTSGQIDLEAWRAHRDACHVFHYDEDDEGDDESGYRLGDHVFKEGEYVTIASHGETPLTYKITDISPV